MAVLYKGNQYMAEPGSFFQESVKIDGDFLAPPRCTFWKNLVVTGTLSLCSECQVKGNIICKSAVIAKKCRIDGELKAVDGSVTLCDGVRVVKVSASGDVMIRPGVIANEIYGDLITVMGKIRCGKLMGKKTRVISADIQ